MTDEAARGDRAFVVADATVVRVRFKRREDFEDDYRWRRDPETARLDGNAVLTLPFDAYVRLVERELLFGDPGRMSFSIEAANGRHVGNLMLYNISGARDTAEFGISIGEEECRGRGFGPAATVAFLRYVWASLPFRRITLHTYVWNERARKSFERAGFSEVAHVIRGDETLIRMEAQREWWLLWDAEGRFDAVIRRTIAGSQPAPNG